MSLHTRAHYPEQLDQLDLGGEALYRVLRELAFINRCLGNHRAIKKALTKLLRAESRKSLRIVDLGCGGGDVLQMIDRSFSQKGIELELIGIDGNPNSLAYARSQTKENTPISYQLEDILSPNFVVPSCDVLISSHFLYHLSDEDLIAFLRKQAAQVHHAWIISELERHQIALTLFSIVAPILRLSPMTKADGELAIRRAFSYSEMQQICNNLRWPKVHLQRVWAFRMILTLESLENRVNKEE